MNRKDLIASNLRAHRARHRLSQMDVAKALDVNIGTIRHYEAGDTFPDYITAWKLADLYDVTLDDLGGRKTKQDSRLEIVKE